MKPLRWLCVFLICKHNFAAVIKLFHFSVKLANQLQLLFSSSAKSTATV